jgi:hypothetical protein
MQTKTKNINIQNLISLVKPKKLDFNNQPWDRYFFQYGKLRQAPKDIPFQINFDRPDEAPKFRLAKPALHYPEPLAKSCNPDKLSNPTTLIHGCTNDSKVFDEYLKSRKPQAPQKGLYRCTRYFLHGSTTNNNYLKSITCGREWCPDCSKMNSESHKRRVSAVAPRFKALQQEGYSIGYLIVTVPFELRDKFQSKEVLNDFREYWRRKLKRELSKAVGILRYHWAGEDGLKFAPHLNILIPTGFIKLEIMQKWRTELSHWFAAYFNLPKKTKWDKEKKKMVQIFPASNLYFNYISKNDPDKETKLIHKIKYIFRATQTQRNKITESTIYKYRNTSIFGKRSDWPTYEKTEEEAAAEAIKGFELDEETGEIEKIIWEKTWSDEKEKFVPYHVPVTFYNKEELTEIAPGFFKRPKMNIQPQYWPQKKPADICQIEKIDWDSVNDFVKKNVITEKDFCPF